MHLPVGFRFNPSEEELVGYYLYNKLFNGDNFKDCYIEEFDLYGDVEPWEVWKQRGGETMDAIYLFTRLKKASASRICRRVASGGTWASENVGTPIKIRNNGGVSGMKKRFRYEKEGSDHDGGWIMYEYAIPGHDEMVLCCLKPNQRKMKMNKRVAVADDDNEQKSKRTRSTAACDSNQPPQQFLAAQESYLGSIDQSEFDNSQKNQIEACAATPSEWDNNDCIDLSFLGVEAFNHQANFVGDMRKDSEQSLPSFHHPNATNETDLLENWLLEVESELLAPEEISFQSNPETTEKPHQLNHME